MRILLLTLAFSLSANFISAQQPGYQTYSSSVKLVAQQGEEDYQWENEDIVVVLNYETGDFIAKLKNRDFYNTLHPAPSDPDLEVEDREFLFKGIFPIDDIINQQSTNQNYVIELDFICDDLNLYESVNFDMTITRPGSSSAGNYRIFSLHGILYNDQLDLPFFTGFNNEIEIYINFNGFFEGN